MKKEKSHAFYKHSTETCQFASQQNFVERNRLFITVWIFNNNSGDDNN